MEAYQVFKEAGCDGVVSIGGGSSHDTGKGVRAVAANNGLNIVEMAALLDPPWMKERLKYKEVTIPQITVNTTAGTGAETTGVAAITNTKRRTKWLVMISGLAPITAINDPLLIRMQPQNLAAWTGMDAYVHATEICITRVQPRYSVAMAFMALQLVFENLREFTYNRMNHTACENIAWASSMCGMGLGLGGNVGMVHGIGHGVSAVTDAHHGLVNAALVVPFERFNQNVCIDKFANMARTIGVDTAHLTRSQASDKWFEETERLLKDLNIQSGNLNKQFGLKKEDCTHIIKNQYTNDLCSEGNPRDYNYEEYVKLLEGQM